MEPEKDQERRPKVLDIHNIGSLLPADISTGTTNQDIPSCYVQYASQAQSENSIFRHLAVLSRILSNIVQLASLPLPDSPPEREKHFADIVLLERTVMVGLQKMTNEVARLHNSNEQLRQHRDDVYQACTFFLAECQGFRNVDSVHINYLSDHRQPTARVTPLR